MRQTRTHTLLELFLVRTIRTIALKLTIAKKKFTEQLVV